MKLLLLSHVANDPDGGASRVYHLLADGLRGRGHEVVLLHLEDFPVPTQALPRLLARRLAMPWFVERGVARLDLSGFDVIMASSGMAHRIFRKMMAGAPRQGRRPLLVNHLHGLALFDHLAAEFEHQLGHFRYSAAYRLVSGPLQHRWDIAGSRHADLTIVQSLRDLAYMTDARQFSGPVTMIPLSVHPSLLDASADATPPQSRSPARLLWFGSWEARKAAFHIREALRLIRLSRPDATLTIGGTGMRADVLLQQFDPADRAAVTVLPRISIAQQIALFNESSVLLFPSLSEGFGLALVEAMSFGVAGVTTTTAVGGDSMRDREHAMIVAPTARHIARASLALIEDDELRCRVSLAGRDLARSFTVERMLDAYEASFNQGIARLQEPAS